MRQSLALFFTVVLIVFSSAGYAQDADANNTDLRILFLKFNGGADKPFGELADRFGINGRVGGGFLYKSKTDWLFSAEFDYLFGSDVKETGPALFLSTQNELMIGNDGLLYLPQLFQRGYHLKAGVGKTFLGLGPNESGFFGNVSIGFLQHKIVYNFEEQGHVPQLEGEYVKGYDRLTNGLTITENLGYFYISQSSLVNLQLSVEFTQAFTKNRRSFNFDEMRRDDHQRLDLLFGLKLSWLLPISKSDVQEYYYN